MENIETGVNGFLDNFIKFDYIGFLTNIFSTLTFETFLKILIIYFFIIWVSIIIWVTKDIINRTNNILLQTFSILTVLIGTPLGIVVYLLIRPSRTLFEKYYDESSFNIDDYEEEDMKGNKKQIQEEITNNCPNCNYTINPEYKFCPNCRICLKKECISCKKELNPLWTICPYCGKDQEQKIKIILEDKNKKDE